MQAKTQEVVPVNKSSQDDLPMQTECNWRSRVTLSRREMALISPAWADFRMERAYWAAMKDICKRGGVSQVEFVANAKVQHPDMSPACAVQVEIAKYYEIKSDSLLPLDVNHVSPMTVPLVSDVAKANSNIKRVLVVDDVLMHRDIAGSVLRAVGHKVTCVEGGAQAIAAVETTDFDVVLMDICMPLMDGLEASRRIRALRGVRGLVPIVALTARTFAEQGIECREAGMDKYITKPFTPEMLVSVMLQAAA